MNIDYTVPFKSAGGLCCNNSNYSWFHPKNITIVIWIYIQSVSTLMWDLFAARLISMLMHLLLSEGLWRRALMRPARLVEAASSGSSLVWRQPPRLHCSRSLVLGEILRKRGRGQSSPNITAGNFLSLLYLRAGWERGETNTKRKRVTSLYS